MTAPAYASPAPAKLPKAGFFWALGIFLVTAIAGIVLAWLLYIGRQGAAAVLARTFSPLYRLSFNRQVLTRKMILIR